MKIIIVSKSYEKLEDFFQKQGTFTILHAIDSITSNLDRLQSTIIHVEKFIFVITDTMDFPGEIRSLIQLLQSPSALLKINELVFLFKSDMNSLRIREYITVIGDQIKTRLQDEPKWFAPHVDSHELKQLTFDEIYKALLGKSASTTIDPRDKLKYREERGSESIKAFEPSEEKISISPFGDENIKAHLALKEMLKKTENPTNLGALDSIVPEYDELRLLEYRELGYASNKWILMSGDRRSGSTTHMTALAVAAAKAGKTVWIVDFSSTGDICDHLKVAASPYHELSAKEVLDNSIVMVEERICVYANKDREVMRTLLPYMQARPNVFDRDLILISFDFDEIDQVLGSVNTKFCSLILSSLMFPVAISRTLSVDVGSLKTLVWLNDNVTSPLRQNRLTLDVIKARSREAGKNYKFLEPIFFEDFEMDAGFYNDIESIL